MICVRAKYRCPRSESKHSARDSNVLLNSAVLVSLGSEKDSITIDVYYDCDYYYVVDDDDALSLVDAAKGREHAHARAYTHKTDNTSNTAGAKSAPVQDTHADSGRRFFTQHKTRAHTRDIHSKRVRQMK